MNTRQIMIAADQFTVLLPCMCTENNDYGSSIVPETATLSQTSKSSCHSIMIHDDKDPENLETFSVSITATGPSQEFFDITVPQTNVTIIDNDGELW